MPREYRRRNSLRYPGHDYAQPGSVFVTIDAHEKQRLFGMVIDGRMSPSPAGVKAAALWREIPARFPAIDIDAFVVMPDHMHGILFCGVAESSLKTTVGDVVRWFKSSLHAAYGVGVKRDGWPPYNGKLWHRDYHDRIIRNQAEFEAIRAYIATNPARWRENARADDPPLRSGVRPYGEGMSGVRRESGQTFQELWTSFGGGRTVCQQTRRATAGGAAGGLLAW